MSRSGRSKPVVARWEGGFRATVEAGPFRFVVDEPEEAGGSGAGPMPTDYLLGAFASCYALALAWAARKRGFELPDLEVTAQGTYAGPRYEAITLTVTSSAPAEQLEPLLEPASRVCYVSNTLRRAPDVEVVIAPR